MILSMEDQTRKVTIETAHDELSIHEVLEEFEKLLCAFGYAHYKLVVDEEE